MTIVLGLVVIQLTLSKSSNANDIYILQSGDDLTMDIYQGNGGDDNYVYGIIYGENNDVTIYQGKHIDGTLDASETGGHEAYHNISGDNNVVVSAQTDTNRSGGGGSPHYLDNGVDGDGNDVSIVQMGKTGDDAYVDIYGDNNSVDIYQRGNGGAKYTDIVLTGNGHDITTNQRGTQSHSISADLTNNGGSYNVNISQTTNQTDTQKSYSITGTCANSSGCNISITQN